MFVDLSTRIYVEINVDSQGTACRKIILPQLEKLQIRNRSLSGDGEKVVTMEAARTLGVPQLSLTLEGCSKGFSSARGRTCLLHNESLFHLRTLPVLDAVAWQSGRGR